MPDVPKRCWYCERRLTIESIRVECAYCGADVDRAYEWLNALDDARAEAERWKQQYEALRETVVGVVLQLTHGMINGQQAEAQLRAVLSEAGGGDQ